MTKKMKYDVTQFFSGWIFLLTFTIKE